MTGADATLQAPQDRPLTIVILLSEPLQGTIGEVMEAAAEDYPDLDWSAAFGGSPVINTASATLAAEMTAPLAPEGRIIFIGHPGPCMADWKLPLSRSRFAFREVEAAITRHTDHLTLSILSSEPGTAERFAAMRKLTCLGAVFAKLPTALAVYVEESGLVVQPERWVKAADTALRAELPVLEWVAIWSDAPKHGVVSVNTIGLAALAGAEVCFADAAVEGGSAAQWVIGFACSLVEAEQPYGDGDTIGIEGDGMEKALRIRKTVSESFGGCDVWCLIHPTCEIDFDRMLGPVRAPHAPAPERQERMVNFGVLRQKLARFSERRPGGRPRQP
ncbi:MAG: hypothetical protein AAGJ74_11255 [Pseudomonadota bacterium]